MAISRIPLRKLLQLMYAPPALRRSKLREDIRNDLARELGEQVGGPDFFSPFWKSAKNHVFGAGDLRDAIAAHIDVNYRRRRLYELLRDGFLTWWDRRRRWTNAPFTPANTLKGIYSNDGLGLIVKIDSLLSVTDGRGQDRHIYPYFSESPPLNDESARVGLWIMSEAFPNVPADQLRLLDIARGQNFSIADHPFRGDEEAILRARYVALVEERERLEDDYD